ncbi:MAG: phosphoribosylformylglycinamidine synthase subunit PurS [Candidatus Hydrothermarchaeota archaeon]|mgnify:CR=1 FL=1
MLWEVRISYKRGVQDSEGESALKGLKALGFGGVEEVSTAKVYLIKGNFSRGDVEEICRRLLANPVSQDYTIRGIEGEDE